MELQEQEYEQRYTKGFNNGYLLAKHDPALAAQLSVRPNDHSAYFKGLMGGKEEYEKEVREWAQSFSKGSPTKDHRDNEREH